MINLTEILKKKIRLRKFSVANYIQVCVVLLFLIGLAVILAVYNIKNDLAAWVNNIIASGTLIFAMIVGYYGFDEFRKVKREEYKKEALSYLYKGDFKRAKDFYESAYEFGAKDDRTLKNMSKLYSIMGEFKRARKIENDLSREGSDSQDIVIRFYLRIISYAGEGDEIMVQQELKSLIKYLKGKNEAHCTWQFDQVEKSLVESFGKKSSKVYQALKNLMLGKYDTKNFIQEVKTISWLD